MTKEEYIQSKKEMKSQIKELQKRVIELNDQYISDNKPFEIGDRVKVTTPARKDFIGESKEKVRIAFVSSFKIDWDDNIKPNLIKMKQDGTPSKHGDYLYNSEIVEKV